jgi:hypothetical protein
LRRVTVAAAEAHQEQSADDRQGENDPVRKAVRAEGEGSRQRVHVNNARPWLERRDQSLNQRPRVCGRVTLRVAGAEGGGTTGPMSPSGASSISTMTGA